jgi:hypothetical protein
MAIGRNALDALLDPRIRRRSVAMFPDMADVLGNRRSGGVEIFGFSISRDEVRAATTAWVDAGWNGREAELAHGRGVGRWAQLVIDDEPTMWDVPGERVQNRHVVDHARGDVLVVGLGLGMILHPLLAKPAVRSVHVVEVNEDVVALIAPTLRHVAGAAKLRIELADGRRWRPAEGVAFDTIWIDTPAGGSWSAEYVRWCAWWIGRYRTWLRPGGWIGHWLEAEATAALAGNV